MRTMLKWAVAACLVGMLASCEDKGGGGTDGGANPPGGGGGSGTVQPGVVKGRVVDTRGQPLEGAVVYTALAHDKRVPGWTRTDAQGNYQMSKLALDSPYMIFAWLGVDYRGKKFCLRIAPETSADYNTYLIRDGAVRNFRWKLQGRIEDSDYAPDDDGAWFGGTIRLFPEFEDGDHNSTLELTMTPIGPLIDGSTGAVLSKTVDLQKSTYVLDIPAGAYKITATRVKSDGTRMPARVGRSFLELSSETEFEFEPVPIEPLECGRFTGELSGLARGFLWVNSP